MWLEGVPKKRLECVKFTSLYDEGKINISCKGYQVTPEDSIRYKISLKKETIAKGEIFWNTEKLDFSVDLIQEKIFHTNYHEAGFSWTPETPTLFDVEFEMINGEDGRITDKVSSYFGFRKVHTEHGLSLIHICGRALYRSDRKICHASKIRIGIPGFFHVLSGT